MNNKIDEITSRKERLEALKKADINPYPSKSERTNFIGEILEDQKNFIKKGKKATLVGRLRSLRKQGGSTFANIEDDTGKFQIYFKKDEVKEKAYKEMKDFLDVGDFIQVEGKLFETKKGEPTLLIKKWTLLSKSLRPLPEKWHGLQDVEARFRKRYLDLISNEDVKNTFITRAMAISSIRAFLDERGFLEVETPILQSLAGGALAKPFVTHHNALDNDFYLRIAPELYLKRLVIGGYERVYEIGRTFRNEGIDWGHNPEFTMLEFYQAYMDYEGMMNLQKIL